MAACNIKKWVDLGDSFASGIGAGQRGPNSGDTVCSRYTEAYGNVMNVVLDGQGPDTREFTWVACSGAKTDYVVGKEVPSIDPDVDIATLTIGGNDVGFFDILNACVFQFNHYTPCSDQITTTTNLINNDLPPKLDNLLSAIMSQVANSGFKLYMTGYAHFFNVETTQCNNVSFNFWEEKPENQANLTTELRGNLNNLVQILNGQISSAVDRANGRDPRKPCVFVDISPSFNTHRYCDIGIDEPDLNNDMRWFQENWLFEQHTPYSGNNISNQYQTWAAQQVQSDPSYRVSNQFVSELSIQSQIDIYGWGQWVFDALARAFHPTADGHNGIKDVILSAYTATPPSSNCDGCKALQPATALVPAPSMKRDVPAGAEAPKVTGTPKVKRITLQGVAAPEITHMPKAFRA